MIMQKHQGLARRPACVLLGLLALVVVLLGGSSRFDQTQVMALRPLACLFLFPALWFASRERLAIIKTPLTFLLILAALAALQLVPLPPSIWHKLPGRELVASLDAAVGLPDIWRPISLSPMRTTNMLASLIVPLAALLLFAVQRDMKGRFVHYALIGAAVLSAVMGGLQLTGGPDSALYTYAVTNAGSPVGIFANRNHSAVFAALAMLSIAYLLFANGAGNKKPGESIALGAAYVLIFSIALASQSRAGLLLCVSVLLLTLVFALAQSWEDRISRSKRGAEFKERSWTGKRMLPITAACISLLAVLGLLLFADRIPALDRFGDDGLAGDMRWSILPTLVHMAGAYFPFGSGFGSFELTYYIHETPESLSPFYVNQAHNDWLQLVIEGGVIAAALLAAILIWLARAMLILARGSRDDRLAAGFWLGVLAVLAFASMVDYPLRTPILAMFIAWLIADLSARVADVHGEMMEAAQ